MNNITFFKMLNTKICKNNQCYLIDHGGGVWASMIMTPHIYLKIWSYTMLYYKKIINRNFYNSCNLITYSKYDIDQIFKHLKFKSSFAIPLFSSLKITENIEVSKEDEYNNKIDLIFLGRFARQKGISNLNKIIEKTGRKIEVAGMGKKEMQFKSLTITNKGYITNETLKKQFLKNGKYFMITSIFEGFGFSAIEAISMGTPIIAINSFPSIKFIIGENNERGFLFDTYDEIIEFLKKPFSYEIWKKQSQNCLTFSKNEITYNEFEKKWKKIFER